MSFPCYAINKTGPRKQCSRTHNGKYSRDYCHQHYNAHPIEDIRDCVPIEEPMDYWEEQYHKKDKQFQEAIESMEYWKSRYYQKSDKKKKQEKKLEEATENVKLWQSLYYQESDKIAQMDEEKKQEAKKVKEATERITVMQTLYNEEVDIRVKMVEEKKQEVKNLAQQNEDILKQKVDFEKKYDALQKINYIDLTKYESYQDFCHNFKKIQDLKEKYECVQTSFRNMWVIFLILSFCLKFLI